MDWMVSGQDYGPKWPGSSARFNLATFSWRTAQCSLLGGLTEYSGTLPRWGTIQSGELWERMMPAHLTRENTSGYWPTPLANSGTGAGHQGRQGGVNLQTAVANTPSGAWPTPTCADAFTDKLKSSQQKQGSMHSVNLSQAVRLWPTPTSQDAKNSTLPISQRNRDSIPGALIRDGEQPGGQLNPDWVAWLMGWPIGWQSSKLLGTDKFQRWSASHGIRSKNASKAA